MKQVSLFIAQVILILALAVCVVEQNSKINKLQLELNHKYEVIVKAFDDVNEAFAIQDDKIEQYERDCGNIVTKVINGEW